MTDVMQPKWWLDTKRGIGMAMLALGQAVPIIGAWFGVTVDAAMVGDLAANIAQWFDVTWNVIGGVLLLWGSWRPTAPLSFTKPV